MPGERILIWSGDRGFYAATRDYLLQQHFDIVTCGGTPAPHPPLELVIADVDSLRLVWDRCLSRLRKQDKSVALVLVSSEWPNFAQLHSWRPSGYLRRPFSMGELLRVLRDLLASRSDVPQVSGHTDRPTPAARGAMQMVRYRQRRRPVLVATQAPLASTAG
jgi:DNA-binding response OmpR family regulator